MPLPYWLLWDLYTYMVGLGVPTSTVNAVVWALAHLKVY